MCYDKKPALPQAGFFVIMAFNLYYLCNSFLTFMRYIYFFLFIVICSCTDRSDYTYEVGGSSGLFNIEYLQNDNQYVTLNNVQGSWSITLDGKKGDHVFLKACAIDTNGHVQVKIRQWMHIIDQSECKGYYPSSSISGILK
jgi:hypothetical protein